MFSRHQLIFARGIGCVFAIAILAAWPGDAWSTILLFDQMREGGVVVPTVSGNDVPQDYGDRVAGPIQTVPGGKFTYGEAGEGFTPNVVVDYRGLAAADVNQASLWRESFGDLVNVVFGNQNSGSLRVLVTADQGFSALLYHFDLGGWPNTDYTIAAVRVLDGAALLFSQTNVLVEGNTSGPRHTSFDFAEPLRGSALVIQIDYSNLAGTLQDNIGIDNIRFGQDPPGIPEPAGLLIFAGGLICLLLSNRVVNTRP
jgi:hypothetical protein